MRLHLEVHLILLFLEQVSLCWHDAHMNFMSYGNKEFAFPTICAGCAQVTVNLCASVYIVC